MRYRIVCVGRRARDPLLDAAEAYGERLRPLVPTELVRLKDVGVEREAEAILARLGDRRPDSRCVALDERGDRLTSLGLARTLSRWQQDGLGAATFVLGGDEGLAPAVRQRADTSWRLSDFTLPHRLALVVLLEQLYRAQMILQGRPYHRG